jgi:hypothetical protein
MDSMPSGLPHRTAESDRDSRAALLRRADLEIESGDWQRLVTLRSGSFEGFDADILLRSAGDGRG